MSIRSVFKTPGGPEKVHNFVQVLFNRETRYMNKLCLV